MACHDTSMANLQVKNVPEPMHAELRRRAALQHVTVRDYVLGLIRKDQQLPTLDEWLDGMAARGPMVGAESLDVAQLVRDGRDERDRELLRRVGIDIETDA